MDSACVQDWGEQRILAMLQQYCPPSVIGDDGAVLSVSAGKQLVVTTDVLVDGVHFSDRTTPPHAVGWRATVANLSDLAAMGASPLGITVGLSLPPICPITWVQKLYEGIAACLECYSTPAQPTQLFGGDLCRSATLSISITALGEAEPQHLLYRSTAQPNDALVVTGVHGASRAGLEVLLTEQGDDHSASKVDVASRAAWIQAHQYPQPRLDTLPVLADLKATCLNQPERAWAAMDSSDGLADAVLQICRASGVGAVIDREMLLIPSSLEQWVGAEQSLNWTLYGGEDFELVLCLPAAIAAQFCERLSPSATIIGEITAQQDVVVRNQSGRSADLILSLEQGFQHFDVS
ncbi:MAG: thiamine-phosphate kinase [Cyanobacteria bacterium P01_H01_bin.121]